MPYFWKVGGLKSRGPISIPGVQISQSLSPGSVAAPGRAFRACFLFVSPVGVRFALLPFLCFCFPGRRCRLFACPRMPFRFVLVAPGRTFRIAAFFLFFASRSCVSLCLVAFVLAVPERPFRFFSFIQVSAFPFSLVGIPACAFRVAFFSLPRGVRFPLRPGACVSFFVWRPGARVLHCGFFHISNPAFCRSRAKKSILEKHQNTAMRNVRSGMTKSRPRGATNAKPKKAKPPCKDGNEQTSASNTPRFARKKQQMRNAWTKTKTSKTARFETFAQGSRENKQCEKYASR